MNPGQCRNALQLAVFVFLLSEDCGLQSIRLNPRMLLPIVAWQLHDDRVVPHPIAVESGLQ